jgi:AcrR family transcriptional regulator
VGSLYQYFPDRDSLVAALVDERLARDRVAVSGALTTVWALPTEARWEAFVAFVFEHQLAAAPWLSGLLPLLPALDRERSARAMIDETVAMTVAVLLAEPVSEGGLAPGSSAVEPGFASAAARSAVASTEAGIRGVESARSAPLRPELRDPERLSRVVGALAHSLRGFANTAATEDPGRLRDPDIRAAFVRMARAALLDG